jgi:hypothetical protein
MTHIPLQEKEEPTFSNFPLSYDSVDINFRHYEKIFDFNKSCYLLLFMKMVKFCSCKILDELSQILDILS